MNAILALTTGVGLGLLYFGGLWLTVRRWARGPHRSAFVVASGWVRLAVLAGALSVVVRGGGVCLLAALVGLWLVRSYLVCRLGGLRYGS